MSHRTRSTQGCWTCRLRKKKCDEETPACSRCTALALTCHGYGPRPEWMDGREREREMGTEIGRIVKATASENRRVAMQRRRQHPPSTVDRSTPRKTVPIRPSSAGHSASAVVTLSSPAHADESDGLDAGTLADLDPPIRKSGPSPYDPPAVTDDDRASLLMHYLDVVFPLQFPFYQPSIWDGGRGWILHILIQTKPLYHAALSLAAYHRQSLFCQGVTDVKRRCCQLESLQAQHLLAIEELRQYLEGINTETQNKSLVEKVKVLCCMALLVALEVFIDRPESWRVHLHAASALLMDMRGEDMLQARKDLSPSYEAALSFFAAVITWYDVLGCATTGSKPFSPCRGITAGEGFLRLDKIMGSENWAMLGIMEVATLDHWKSGVQAKGELSVRELVNRATQIERCLEDNLNDHAEAQGTACRAPFPSSSAGGASHDLSRKITRAFACAAQVYLHVVVSGPRPGLAEIRESVTRTIAALRAIPDSKVVLTLSWPLCIAGCMAAGDTEETFFRDLLTPTERVGAPTFGNSGKILTIMEQCWKMRKLEQGECLVDWRTAMSSLGVDVLLV